jgi:hypothetical protein
MQNYSCPIVSLSFFFIIVPMGGVHCDIYIGSYNVANISPMNSSPYPFSFISPPLIPGVVSTGIIFCKFLHVYTVLHHIHLPTPFPPTPLPSHWYQISLLGRTCSFLLFSDFVGEKRWNQKHDILAWDKGNYTGSFFVTFQSMCIL